MGDMNRRDALCIAGALGLIALAPAGAGAEDSKGPPAGWAKVIAGKWAYRSFINDPDLSKPFHDLQFAAAELVIQPADFGVFRGLLRFGFGHAIGFHHEHQSPLSGCDHEFKWQDDATGPGIYTLLESQGWSKGMIDFNLRQLPSSNAYEVGPYDPQSIMHYHFPSAYFIHGAGSPCYLPRNLVLSEGDKAGARKAYPHDPEALRTLTLEKKTVLQTLIESPHVDPHRKVKFQNQLRNLPDR